MSLSLHQKRISERWMPSEEYLLLIPAFNIWFGGSRACDCSFTSSSPTYLCTLYILLLCTFFTTAVVVPLRLNLWRWFIPEGSAVVDSTWPLSSGFLAPTFRLGHFFKHEVFCPFRGIPVDASCSTAVLASAVEKCFRISFTCHNGLCV